MLHMNQYARPYWRFYNAASRITKFNTAHMVTFAHGQATGSAIEHFVCGPELDRYLELVNTLADQRYKEISHD